MYKEKEPDLQCTKHPNRVMQPGLHQTACPHKLNQPSLQCLRDPNRGKQPGFDPTACPNRQTINAVFTQSSKASQGDAAQPPPTFSLYQKRTTHPPSSTPLIRKKHPASCYRPPHLNRAEQTKQSRLNFRRLLRVVFSSQQRLNRPAVKCRPVTRGPQVDQ